MQSNTIKGLISKVAIASLVNKEGYLVKLNTAGSVALTAAITDVPAFVVICGAAAAERADVLPLSPDQQVSVVATGTVTMGDLVQLDTVNPGTVRTQDTGPAWGIAETTVATGGLVKVRPLTGRRSLPAISVVLTSTNGTAAAASANLANLAAETEKVGDDLRALHAALVSQGLISAS